MTITRALLIVFGGIAVFMLLAALRSQFVNYCFCCVFVGVCLKMREVSLR